MFDFNFDWRKDMNTNIEVVDYQHKQLFFIGREIEQLIRTECIGITDSQLLKIVCELRDYVAYHFYEEESLMQQAGYPGLEAHRRQHREATDWVKSIDFRVLKKKPQQGLNEMKNVMQKWVFQHMITEDIKMADAIRDILIQQNKEKQKKQEDQHKQEFLLEAVVDSIDSALKSVEAGADRLELCANMIMGGTTPTLPLFKEIQKQCEAKIDVVIRPRCGDYYYSATEFQLMLAEIREFKKAGADGIIIGALQPNGSLDFPQMQRMILSAGKMKVTLNRAFDVCKDPYQTLKEAKELSIRRIITSGQKATSIEGMELIKGLVKACDDKMQMVVNCGLDGSVIRQIYKETGAIQYRVMGMAEAESKMIYRNMDVYTGMPGFSEYVKLETNEKRIKDAAEILENL
ncbi:MAG: copper homeostasis protein CutC [Lachnospiraceae bacterium]|nr:copper homeostasis protein CutC [Lachnospiraceae bacterium]